MRSHMLRAAAGLSGGGGGGPAELSFINTYGTIPASVNFGAADARRHAVIVVHLYRNSSRAVGDVTSITVGGIAATIVANVTRPSGTHLRVVVAIAAIPSGGTLSVTVATSGTVGAMRIAAYRLLADTLTPYSIQENASNTLESMSVSLPTVLDGVAIGASQNQEGNNHNWTGMAKQYGVDINSGEWASGAMITNTTGGTATVTAFPANILVALSWE